MGIAESMATAVDVVVGRNLHSIPVAIFSDSINCVDIIQNLIGLSDFDRTESFRMSYLGPILDTMIKFADILDGRDCLVEVRWIKRGQITLHTVADRCAGRAWKDPCWVEQPRGSDTVDLDKQVLSVVGGFMDRQWAEWRFSRLAELRSKAEGGTLSKSEKKEQSRLQASFVETEKGESDGQGL